MSQLEASRSPDPRAAAARPDMTPMIDVVFLMIIFFLCIEFRVLEAKLPAFLPKDRGGSSSVGPTVQLVVQVEPLRRGTRTPAGSGSRYRLTGRSLCWRVGPRRVDSLADLEVELRRFAASPDARVPDPVTGEARIMDAVVEPLAGACYADVTAVTDRLHAAGFDAIHYASGRP